MHFIRQSITNTGKLGILTACCFLLSCVPLNAYEPPVLTLANMTSEYNQGHYPMAQYIGVQILRREPSNLAVRYLMGNLYIKFGDPTKAKAEYTFCARAGNLSQIGRFASQALDQLNGKASADPAAEGSDKSADQSDDNKGSGKVDNNLVQGPNSPESHVADAPPPDKVDIQTLEYKERLLKTGADLIASNKIKLQRQIEAEQKRINDSLDDLAQSSPSNGVGIGFSSFGPNSYASQRERLQQDGAARIRLLEENNAQEEKRITAYYQREADKIGSQKTSLTSQANVGHGDVRLEAKGSHLFVRNYVNYHGEVPLPPPPPELKATALKLDAGKPTAKKGGQ